MVLDYRIGCASAASTISCAYSAGWRMPKHRARTKLPGMSSLGGRARRWWTIVPALGLLGGGRIAWAQPAAPPPPKVETRAIPGRDGKPGNAQGIIEAPPHARRAGGAA